eukprot:g48793.t1
MTNEISTTCYVLSAVFICRVCLSISVILYQDKTTFFNRTPGDEQQKRTFAFFVGCLFLLSLALEYGLEGPMSLFVVQRLEYGLEDVRGGQDDRQTIRGIETDNTTVLKLIFQITNYKLKQHFKSQNPGTAPRP